MSTAIPTITMVKGEEEIVVNAPDREKYVAAGYSNKPAAGEKPAEKPAEKTAEAPPAKPAATK